MTYFNEYMAERNGTSSFPAPPDHNYEEPPVPEDALLERISEAEREGRWADSRALKAQAAWPSPRPSQELPTPDLRAREVPVAGDSSTGDDWTGALDIGEPDWHGKAAFFDPQAINAEKGEDNQDDDINHVEDDR